MAPGENPLRPFRAQKLPADKISEDLSSKDLRQPGFVDPRDLMERPGLVHSALGHQEMEVRAGIDPVAKCLNGGNDAGH